MNRYFVLFAIIGLALTACRKPAATQEVTSPAPPTEAAPAPPAPEVPPPPPPPFPNATPDAPPPTDPAPQPAEGEKEGPVTPMTEREVMMLNYAVYKFREDTGRNPKSLQEMVGKTLPRMPRIHSSEKLNYNPQNGMITVEKVK
jgi:hypothetical protein